MGEKIKVAIIAGQLVVGGAERQLYLWLANMDRERFDPIVVTLHPCHGDYWEGPIEELGIPLYRVERNKNRLQRLFEIMNAIRPHQPDLIHGWHTFSSAYAGMSARLLGTKSLGGVRSSFSAIERNFETKLTSLFCNALMFNSKTTANAYLKSKKKEKQTIFIVQNAIKTQFYDREDARHQLVRSYGIPADAIWVASIGRVDPLKHFEVLVQLANRLRRISPNIHFLLIGDGPQKENLEKSVSELDLNHKITFTGEVPDASRYMKAFDIFCFPSIDEGLPNVIMEAGAAGLPILAWQLPFNQELFIKNEMAILASPLDLEEMQESLLRLIKSPELRSQLGLAARNHILSEFSLDRYIQNMAAVYDKLLVC